MVRPVGSTYRDGHAESFRCEGAGGIDGLDGHDATSILASVGNPGGYLANATPGNMGQCERPASARSREASLMAS